MISIRQAMTELEHLAHLQSQTVDCCKALIDTASQYAIDFEDEAARLHREHLAKITMRLRTPTDAAAIQETPSQFRAELRVYRDRAMSYLGDLRRDLAEKTETLQKLLDAMTAAETDHDDRLREQLEELRKLATTASDPEVRAALLSIAQALGECVEQIHQQNQLMIAQFLVEINQLHKRIETLEKAAAQDSQTQVYCRREIESRMQGLVGSGGFSVLVLYLENLAVVEKDYGLPLADQLIQAFVKRLGNGAPPGAVIGRWSSGQFVVILEVPKTEAIGRSKALSGMLSGIYVFSDDGMTRKIALQVNVAVIYSPPNQSFRELLDTLEKLSLAPGR